MGKAQTLIHLPRFSLFIISNIYSGILFPATSLVLDGVPSRVSRLLHSQTPYKKSPPSPQGTERGERKIIDVLTSSSPPVAPIGHRRGTYMQMFPKWSLM